MKSLFTFPLDLWSLCALVKDFSLFTRWRNRRQQKRKQRETQQTLQMWALLEKLFDAGQISFDRKTHRLFIAQPVASLLMSKGADAWVQSVHNIYNYVHFLQTQQAWDEYMQKEELAAVRNAMQRPSPDPSGSPAGSPNAEDNSSKATGRRDSGNLFTHHSSLTREDIDRIRLARRQQIAFGDMEPLKVEPFEFFIIPLSTEAKVEPLAVGYYDPNTGQMDVATWDEVSELVRANAK
jgi:hypothetical protein